MQNRSLRTVVRTYKAILIYILKIKSCILSVNIYFKKIIFQNNIKYASFPGALTVQKIYQKIKNKFKGRRGRVRDRLNISGNEKSEWILKARNKTQAEFTRNASETLLNDKHIINKHSEIK